MARSATGIAVIAVLFLFARPIEAQSSEYTRLYDDLVNRETPGYKSSFDDETFRSVSRPRASQGVLMRGAPTDVAILGVGSFRMRDASGALFYTRNGSLAIDEFGRLVSRANGAVVEPSVVFPLDYVATTVVIQLDGSVRCGRSDGTMVSVGHLATYRSSGEPPEWVEGGSQVVQGFLEASTTDVMKTLGRMLFLVEGPERERIPAATAKTEILRRLLNGSDTEVASRALLKRLVPFLRQEYE